MKDDAFKIRLFKTKKLNSIKPEDIKMLADFIKFASDFLKFPATFHIKMLHASPDEPITLGAYSPDTDEIHVIVENRHFLDYCRTIAHEMVHQRQKSQGKLTGTIPEIGGEIEDEANFMSGRIMKSYIKNHLTSEQKKKLGAGTY